MEDNTIKNNNKNKNIELNSINKSKKKYRVIDEKQNFNYFLLPVLIVLCIIPLILRVKIYHPGYSGFAWFEKVNLSADIFLYYKQWIFVSISAIMAFIMIIMFINKRNMIKKVIDFKPVFIPLIIYFFLALLSTIFSKYSSFSIYGSFEQFESLFALLGYCICAYYSYLIVKSEQDLKVIIKFLGYSIIIMTIIGLSQFIGHDIVLSKLGYDLIVPDAIKATLGELNATFKKGMVYLTLYNPNYVGVYVAILLPIISCMFFCQKKKLHIVLYGFELIGLIICLIGSKSFSGVIGIAVDLIFTIIIFRNYLKKYLFITIPVIVILLAGAIFINIKSNNYYLYKFDSVFNGRKQEYALKDLHTEYDGVALTYNKDNLKVRFNLVSDQPTPFDLIDENNNKVQSSYDSATNTFSILDQRFSNIKLAIDQTRTNAFDILVEGNSYIFTKDPNDNKYFYVNHFGNLDKMVTAPSAVFTGNETLFSNRGYIWSRTIPLLAKHVILGSGPDTFAIDFPQQDYFNLRRYEFGDQIITKPHCLYLQIAVQTGVLSLIAFILFYAMYFISSIRLYILGIFNSYFAKVGVSIFIGTIAYMITGLTNDSSITTAPIFWTLIGIGIAANYKAKPIIMEEISNSKKN